MSKTDEIESKILATLEEMAETGFDEQRIQAILNRTELSLKKQKDEFGWRLIMSLTSSWNHAPDPLELLSINPILERFKKDISDSSFLKNKVKDHFLANNHRLTLTMSPTSDYLTKQQSELSDLEAKLVNNLSADDRQKAIDQGKLLEKMQSTKDSEDALSCLPTLSLEDIPLTLPTYDGVSQVPLKASGILGQLSAQPTNEVAYLKFRLNTDEVLSPREMEILPLFSMVLTSMGAGTKSYRDLDLLIDLHSGGMGASLHTCESPLDSSELLQKGLMLSAVGLERKTAEMLALWADIFHGVFVPDGSQFETTERGLVTRLSDLISMSAVNAKNGLAHGGHHYAMAHAASKLQEFPALLEREKQSGITMVRLLNALSEGKEDRIPGLLNEMSHMARKLLTKSNVDTFSVSATSQNCQSIVGQVDNFITSLPAPKAFETSLDAKATPTIQGDRNTYIVSPFPVHFSSSVLKGAPSYTHEDAAPLRVLSRMLSSKYLHIEIREKGGAYGGGCSASPSSGTITFYSYRDPNFERTLDTFHKSNEWVQRGSESFSQTDVDEAKLNIFKVLDKPALPGSRGQRLFLSGLTDEQVEQHRAQVRSVTYDDILRVSQKYLGRSVEKSFSTTLGPEPKNTCGHSVESLL